MNTHHTLNFIIQNFDYSTNIFSPKSIELGFNYFKKMFFFKNVWLAFLNDEVFTVNGL
jgi:hypothetical protein